MLSFDTPTNLDGEKLFAELEQAGIQLPKDDRGRPKWASIDGNGLLWIDLDSSVEQSARAVVAAHNG